MRTKRSIFNQVLILNLLFSFIFICIFVSNAFYYNNEIGMKDKANSMQVLDTMIRSFRDESVRLTTLMNMCIQDRSFVLAISNRLSESQFVQYSKEATEKFALIRYSLPYAKEVFIYSRSNQRFIFNNNVISREALFSLPTKRLPVDIEKMDLDDMKNGFYALNGAILHVTNIQDYGSLLTIIDTNKFFNVSEIGAILPNYDIAILDNEYHVYIASSARMDELLQITDLRSGGTKKVNYEGSVTYISQQQESDGFRFVIATYPSDIQQDQQNRNLVSILVSSTVFIVCIFLIFLNTRLYFPLKRMVRTFIGRDSAVNEIDQIGGAIKELQSENIHMHERLIMQQVAQSDMELNFAILSKHGISDQLAEHLKNRYESYRIVVIAVQTESGDTGDLFIGIDQYLSEALESKTIQIDSFVHAYWIPGSHQDENIAGVLVKCLDQVVARAVVFIGIGDASTDFTQIHSVYMQATARMMNNGIPVHKCHAIMMNDSGSNQATEAISYEVQSTIAKYVVSGSYHGIDEILQHIFLEGDSLKLRDAVNFHSQLSGLLFVLQNSAISLKKPAELVSEARIPVFHPVYMYHALLEDYKNLCSTYLQGGSPVKYEVVEYLNRHYREPLSLESISTAFGITPVYLSAWFKKNIGINLTAYLSGIRMEAAKKYLAEEKHIKIHELAEKVGIPSVSVFIRQFKNYTGSTPDQYRHS